MVSASAGASERIHATAIVIEEKGLILRGPSGAGKSCLALELIERARAQRKSASLVGDDRLLVEARAGVLVARPHPEIAGRIEIRGVGLIEATFTPEAAIAAVVDLRPSDAPWPDRLPDPQSALICGVLLPRLDIKGDDRFAPIRIIAFLEGRRF